MKAIEPGDAVLVSGTVGDHCAAVMLAREQIGLRGEVMSDSACLLPATRALLAGPGLRFMRYPTHGGLGPVLHEITAGTGLGLRLRETTLPVRSTVRSVCALLGYDPLYLAYQGRGVAVADPAHCEHALSALQGPGNCPDAALIGSIVPGRVHVVLETELGGERFVEELEDDPLPRIC